MAAPLRRVSDYHQTPEQMRVTNGAPLRLHHGNAVVPLCVPDAPIPPCHATPSGGTVTVPPEVRSGHYTSSLLLSGRSYLPPGLYTAIAHNHFLRTRIQCFSSESDVFWWHFRQAHDTLFGWLAASVLLAVWCTSIILAHPFVKTYKRGTNSVTSRMLPSADRKIGLAMFLRYIVIAWLIPVLDEIGKYALEAFDKPVRSHSEGNALEISMPVDHTQVENEDAAVGILLPERLSPISLDHPAPTTNHFSTRKGTYPLPAGYNAPERSIAFLKARIRELEW